MPRDLLTIRCPEDVKEAIEQRMAESGRGRTEVVVELLRQALSLEISPRYTAPLDKSITAQIDDRSSVLYQCIANEVERLIEPMIIRLMEVESTLGE